jgi:hypothetical protein
VLRQLALIGCCVGMGALIGMPSVAGGCAPASQGLHTPPPFLDRLGLVTATYGLLLDAYQGLYPHPHLRAPPDDCHTVP